jgi:LysR family positive regulator for ilvC
VLSGFEDLRERFTGGDKALRGSLTLYASVTACYAILPDILRRMRARHPGIHIRLLTGDAAHALEAVQSERADLSVAALPESLPANVGIPLARGDTPRISSLPVSRAPFPPF